jgi:alkylation response protein AidB-like acyl-CoA dehydrogenase
MEFTFTEEEEAFRHEVRSFLNAEMPSDWIVPIINPSEDLYHDEVLKLHKVMAPKMGERGWLSLNWPKEYGGQEASPMFSAILQEEIKYLGAPGWDPQGVSMLSPLIIQYGTEEQKRQHLPPIARGEILWCEGYSEPQSGSDLASVQTTAVQDGDSLVINGQKLWCSGANVCDWCHLLVRTDPNAPKKHHGLTYLLLDMETPGITVRTIEDMTGGHALCEVFFDNVRVPVENILGEKNRGWYVALALLNYERGLDVGSTATMRRFFELILEYAQEHNLIDDPLVQQQLASMYVETETARLIAYQLVWLASQGLPVTAQSSMSKLFCSEANQRCADTAMKILGSFGPLAEDSKLAVIQGRICAWYLESFTSTLARGTSEVQRNVLATRGLELPRS